MKDLVKERKRLSLVVISPAIVLDDNNEEDVALPPSQPRHQGLSTHSFILGMRLREREGPHRYNFSGPEVKEDSIIDKMIFLGIMDKVSYLSTRQRCCYYSPGL